tara:strand:- start:1213 stop:1605 length:393 start_codon:yes stop_codon:yes gene_type:complete
MINISRLKIYVAEFTNESQLITIGMFDIAGIVEKRFVGLTVDSCSIMEEFTDFEKYQSYNLIDIDNITDPSLKGIKNIIKEFTGINKPLEEVVNLLLDDEFFNAPKGVHVNQDKYCREMFLKSVIRHKSK